MNAFTFAERLLAWFDQYGRKDLPWQQDKSPYRVWISETMLQQTQVATVIPYFNAFMARFPDVEALAAADVDDVLRYWSGLGYYARARNLHKSAQIIAARGDFPDTPEALQALPGIGLSTAGAILSIAFGQSQPILDGNVRRVLARYRAITGWPSDGQVNKQLWALSRALTPGQRSADYTQAIMDLGATVCTRTRPACSNCPLQADCRAHAMGRAADFPAPKPAKSLPVKQSTFLLLVEGRRRIFLEKRPPTGIWGGLWCLPEFEHAEQALNFCRTARIGVLSSRLSGSRRHTFSHFHLDYKTLVVQADGNSGKVGDTGSAGWHSLDAAVGLALAAPIKQLVKNFQALEDTDDTNG